MAKYLHPERASGKLADRSCHGKVLIIEDCCNGRGSGDEQNPLRRSNVFSGLSMSGDWSGGKNLVDGRRSPAISSLIDR
jgi:hypothetical protein